MTLGSHRSYRSSGTKCSTAVSDIGVIGSPAVEGDEAKVKAE